MALYIWTCGPEAGKSLSDVAISCGLACETGRSGVAAQDRWLVPVTAITNIQLSHDFCSNISSNMYLSSFSLRLEWRLHCQNKSQLPNIILPLENAIDTVELTPWDQPLGPLLRSCWRSRMYYCLDQKRVSPLGRLSLLGRVIYRMLG